MNEQILNSVIERHRHAFTEGTISAAYAISIIGTTVNIIIETEVEDVTVKSVDLGNGVHELVHYVPEDYIMDNMETLEDWLVADFTMYTDLSKIPQHTSRRDRFTPCEWEDNRYEEDRLITLSGVTYSASDIKDIGDSRTLKVLKYLAENTYENEFEVIKLSNNLEAIKLSNDNVVFYDNNGYVEEVNPHTIVSGLYGLPPEDIDLIYTQHMRVQSKCVVEYNIYSDGMMLSVDNFNKGEKIKRGNRVAVEGMQFYQKEYIELKKKLKEI